MGLREGGGNCLKYLKRGWNIKKVRENEDFKMRGGKLGEGVGALKKRGGGGWNPLRNYDSVFPVFRTQSSESKKPYVQ